jgi:hypothetical protein
MGKQGTGPGMLDCLSYLAQMDGQAGCYSTILLLPGGSSLAPRCIINILSVDHEGGAFGSGAVATSYDGYPSKEHATFGGALYRAIVEHDKVVSARQLQVVLDITG